MNKNMNTKRVVATMILIVAMILTIMPMQSFGMEGFEQEEQTIEKGQFFDMKMTVKKYTLNLEYANMTAILGFNRERGAFITKTDKRNNSRTCEFIYFDEPARRLKNGDVLIPESTLKILEGMFLTELITINNKVVVAKEMDEELKEIFRPYEAKMDIKKVSNHYVITVNERDYNREDFIETLNSVQLTGELHVGVMDFYFQKVSDWGEKFELGVIYNTSLAGVDATMVKKYGQTLVITVDDKNGYDTLKHEHYFD